MTTNAFISIFFSKLHAHFQSMEVRNSAFAAYIDVFTPNTYVMVIMSDSTIRKYKHVYLLAMSDFNVSFVGP